MTSMSASTYPETAISELLNTGRTFSHPEKTRYVCHTSTIPLATTVDNQALLEDWPGVDSVTHSLKYQPGYDPISDYRCCLKHCMYVSRSGSEPELVRDNCPCSKVVRTEFLPDGEEIDVFLQPLCFLQVVKEMRYRFGYVDATACESDAECCHNEGGIPRSNRPKIDFSEIMFCQNSEAVTDGSYSRPLRSKVGFSGWENANTTTRVAAIMDQVYWYRRFVDDSTRIKLSVAFDKDFRFAKQCLTQTLHTLNGCISKKLLLFPCEMEGYRVLAARTAGLFSSLIRDYLRPDGDDPSESLFMRAKEDCKWVKQSFVSESREVRFSVLYRFKDRKDSWSRFWGSAFARLGRRVDGLDDDYTASPAWLYTMSGFSQVRNMGYLPAWVAEIKRRQFRENIGRDRVQIPKPEIILIAKMVAKRAQEAGIELHFLNTSGRRVNEDFREVIHSLRIPLKPTASVLTTVSAGGKVEDARRLFDEGIRRGWQVPMRDFETGRVTGFIGYSEALRTEVPGYEGHLFWTSLQILLNSLSRVRPNFEEFRHDLPGEQYWLDSMWEMEIVHISEPGKERNLTKTSPILSWVLTLVSKISQMVLAYNQEHRAGLVLSAQDWMHQRRVSADSYESEWMYDQNTRKRMPGVWNGFQDWTESTDFIPRRVGAAALQGWFSYIGFPTWLQVLTLECTQRDYTVREAIATEFSDGVARPIHYTGRVSEGFMMSMPLTKTVLHLMHDVNVGLTNELLSRLGVKFAPRVDTARRDVERPRLGTYYLKPE
jgi:hypothetical protein